MKVTQDERYWSGDTGVYYDGFHDEIVLIEKKEAREFWNKRTNSIRRLYVYDFTMAHGSYNKTAIRGLADESMFIKIGDL